MPIVPHYACTEPQADTRICRFMDLPKFRDLFANEELYFSRTDLFKETDPREALPSDEYVRAALDLQKYDLNDELKLNNDQAFNRQNSEAYFINCWQIYEGETLDMWKTYGNGVAVFSRFDLLKSALSIMLDDILVGIVQYGEKDMTRYNLIRFLYTKQRHFAKERELRVVLQCYDAVGGANRHYYLNNFPNREPLDELNPLHEWVHKCKRRRIDLKALVTEVRLSPWATEGELAEVNRWVKVKNSPCLVTPSDLTSKMTPTLEELRRLGGGFHMRSDIVPGAIFPDYELSDHTAKRRKLSELQGQHPMVLVLSRGGFCPKDRRQAEGLVELHRELEVAYCRLVTISTDNITQTNEYRSGVGAHWTFLSDAGRIVQKDLDIAEYTDPVNNPMIPHTIVLEPGLVIYKVYNGYWFFGRPTLEDLRQDLRAITKKCRPDWDITTPELKAAWQQGRKELFYPYGKTYVQTLGEQD